LLGPPRANDVTVSQNGTPEREKNDDAKVVIVVKNECIRSTAPTATGRAEPKTSIVGVVQWMKQTKTSTDRSVESAEQKENVWKPKRQQRYELMKKLGGKSVVSGVLPRNRLKMSACEPKKSDANGKKMNALREKKRSDV
jgi:hypothetical protein